MQKNKPPDDLPARTRASKRQRGSAWKWSIFVLVFLAGWIVQEYIHVVGGVSLWRLLTHPVTLAFELVPCLLGFAAKRGKRAIRSRNTDFWSDVVRQLHHILRMIRKDTFAGILILSALTVYFTSGLAEARAFGRLLAWAEEFKAQIIYTPVPEASALATPAADGGDSGQDPFLEPPPTPAPTTAPEMLILDEPDRVLPLSDTEWQSLYLLSGPYQVSDWSDPAAISDTVFQMTTALCGQQMENTFDTQASEELKGEVAAASRNETSMRSTGDLQQIIDIRQSAWNSHPKYGLAKLLASNYQRYALSYLYGQGNAYTVEYYYAQSVFWLFRSLTFQDVMPSTQKSILHSLEMRYHDLADLASDTLSAPQLSQAKRDHFLDVRYYAQLLTAAFADVQKFY